MTDIRRAGALVAAALAVWYVSVHAQDRRLKRDDAGAERRMALVVGNDTYRAAPLVNARNDARAIAAALQEVGFTVSLVLDANRAQFGTAVETFGKQLRADDVALFFYAGHGVQIDGTNYLVPVDYAGQDEATARWNTVPLGLVQDTLRRGKVALLILDACRNNPYLGTRTVGGGLAAPSQARGSLIAFAAEAGQTASDAPGSANGLFTSNLLQVIRTPGLGVREVFRRVRERVVEATDAKQFPAVYEALTGDFVFRPERASAPNPAPAPPNPAPRPPAPTPPSPSRVNSNTVPLNVLYRPIADVENECTAGKFDACREAGQRYGYGRAVDADSARAVQFFQKACDGGVALACHDLGNVFANLMSSDFAKGVNKDYARAKSLFQRACDGGSMPGCYRLGDVYRTGNMGVARDMPRARSLYQRACDGGYATGCTYLGDVYSMGWLGSTDEVRAAAAYKVACDLDKKECWQLASHYKFGRGVEKDLAKALALYERSCTAGTGVACHSIGELYERGQGVAADRARALEFYKRGCSNRSTESCNDLKRLGGTP